MLEALQKKFKDAEKRQLEEKKLKDAAATRAGLPPLAFLEGRGRSRVYLLSDIFCGFARILERSGAEQS